MNAARLASFQFGIQFVWGALLAISLQARVVALAPADPVVLYARLATVGAIVAGATQLLAGRLSDRAMRRTGARGRLVPACAVLATDAALVAFYDAPGIVAFAIAFFCVQVALNVATAPYQAAVADYLERDTYGRGSAWMSAMQSAGAAAGLVAAGFVRDASVLAGLLAIGLATAFAITASAKQRIRPLAPEREEIEAPVAQRGFGVLLFSRAVVNAGFYVLLGFLLFFVRDTLRVDGLDAQRTATATATIFLCFTLAAIPGAVLAGAPTDRYPKRRVVTVANVVLTAATMVLALAAHGLVVACIASAVAGVAWGAFATADWALACAVLPRRDAASAMSVWNLASIVPQIAAPAVVGPLVASVDRVAPGAGPRAAMIAAAFAFAAGTLLLRRLPALRERTA